MRFKPAQMETQVNQALKSRFDQLISMDTSPSSVMDAAVVRWGFWKQQQVLKHKASRQNNKQK